MALFGKKKPKLPSYIGTSLEDLLADPQWSFAIEQSGIVPSSCEVVIRLAEAKVGGGGGLPEDASPALLLGQGDTLAVAYPGERDIRVVKRDKNRGELQTQQSGWFQVMFGPASNLDGFIFWGETDNLREGTAEGDKFGELMLAFWRGQLSPQQVVGTPQSLVANGVTSQPPMPNFDDPADEARWNMVYAVHSSLEDMMNCYQECFEKAQHVEKAYGMADAEFVDGVRQHEISREHFRKHAIESEKGLEPLLRNLQEVTAIARDQWSNLLFLLPEGEHDVMRLADWCDSHGVPGETMSSIVGNAMFTHTDFGTDRQSFWTENERVIAVMNGNQQN